MDPELRNNWVNYLPKSWLELSSSSRDISEYFLFPIFNKVSNCHKWKFCKSILSSFDNQFQILLTPAKNSEILPYLLRRFFSHGLFKIFLYQKCSRIRFLECLFDKIIFVRKNGKFLTLFCFFSSQPLTADSLSK